MFSLPFSLWRSGVTEGESKEIEDADKLKKSDEDVNGNEKNEQSRNSAENNIANEKESARTKDNQGEANGDDEDMETNLDVDNGKCNKEVPGNKSATEDDGAATGETILGDDNSVDNGCAAEGDGKDKGKDKDCCTKDASSSSAANQPQVGEMRTPKAAPKTNLGAPDQSVLLAFDEEVALLTEHNLLGGKDFTFPEVISQTEKKMEIALPESIKNQLNKRFKKLTEFKIESTWGITEKVTLKTDTAHWSERKDGEINYRYGHSEKGQEGFATAVSSAKAKQLAEIDARLIVKGYSNDVLDDVVKLSKEKPADLSTKTSTKKWWPMGAPQEPTRLGNTSMMLFSGDVFEGYGMGGFEENCKEAPRHVPEVWILKKKKGAPDKNYLSVHDWAIAFTRSLNDPEGGGAKTLLAKHAMKLANTNSTFPCLYYFKNQFETEKMELHAHMELNSHTCQYLAAIQVLGNLSLVDKSELAYKRQHQAVGLRDLLPPISLPNKVLNYVLYQPMLVLGQPAEKVLSAFLPADADRKDYDFSTPPPKAPNFNALNKEETEQVDRTFESMQHQNRKHNNQSHIQPFCAVGKGREQWQLRKKFVDGRRLGKNLIWDYSFYYPELNGQALMDVIICDIIDHPGKTLVELSKIAYGRQRKKYVRKMKTSDTEKKKAPVSSKKKRKQEQRGTPKKAKKARKSKHSEEKEMNQAKLLPPAKSSTGEYTKGGSEWVRRARGSFLLLQHISIAVGCALNDTDRIIPAGYSQVEVRSEIFSGTTLVNTILTDFDGIGDDALDKLFHSDCRKFIIFLGLVDPTEFKGNGEAYPPQQFKESLCTWMKPCELQDLSVYSAFLAKFYRSDFVSLLRKFACRKTQEIIRRITVGVK